MDLIEAALEVDAAVAQQADGDLQGFLEAAVTRGRRVSEGVIVPGGAAGAQAEDEAAPR
jgi:hypothetical protein